MGKILELRAELIVTADTRGSRMRKTADLKLIAGETPSMDVIRFRLPHEPDDKEFDEGVSIWIGSGTHMLVLVDRGDAWRGGFVIMKGGLKEMKKLLPKFLEARLNAIDDWNKESILAVQVGYVEKWFKPGLLLIGDAAHVVSPVGSTGINHAIQDAVAAHNIMSGPPTSGTLTARKLFALNSNF